MVAIDDDLRAVLMQYSVDSGEMRAPRDAYVSEKAEDVQAQVSVAAICLRRLRTTANGGEAMTRVSGALFLCGKQRERGRERRSREERRALWALSTRSRRFGRGERVEGASSVLLRSLQRANLKTTGNVLFKAPCNFCFYFI